MHGRTGKQIRDRYINSLKPGIRQEAWTRAEDELLIRLYKKIGNKWSRIASCLKGRTENQVKNRFRTCFKRKQRKVSIDSLDSSPVSEPVNCKKRSPEFHENIDMKVLGGSERGFESPLNISQGSEQIQAAFPVNRYPFNLQMEGYNYLNVPNMPRKMLHRDPSHPNPSNTNTFANPPFLPFTTPTPFGDVHHDNRNINFSAGIPTYYPSGLQYPFLNGANKNIALEKLIGYNPQKPWIMQNYVGGNQHLEGTRQGGVGSNPEYNNIKEEYTNVKFE